MKRGIALVTVILVVAFLVVIGGITAYLVQRGLRITGITRRALTTFEAAEGGVELGVNEIWRAENEGRPINQNLRASIGGREVTVNPQRLFVVTEKGGSLEFAAAYEGVGRGVGGGGAAIFYNILSSATGGPEDRIELEVIYRRVIGIVAQ
jgi:type II secretory pathway component PulK